MKNLWHTSTLVGLTSLTALALLFTPRCVQAQAPSAEAAEEAPLSLDQEQVAARWKRFEEVLLRVAEVTAKTDPDRAALLRQTVAASKERLVGMQFQEVVKLLRSEKLATAVKQQQDLQLDLQALLDLLLSEDRAKRLADEQARVRKYLKQVNQLIKEEKAIQGSTEGSGEPKALAERQGSTADKTAKLAQEMKDESAPPAGQPPAESEDKPGAGAQPQEDQQPAETKEPTEETPAEDKPTGDAKPGDSAPPPGEQQPGGEPMPGSQPMPGNQPMPGSESQNPPQGDSAPQESPPTDPAQQRLEAAQQRMKAAQQQLEQARRREAARDEEAAIHELEQAKAELEEILRQLREEEMKRLLTMLEERLTKMLAAQTIIYEGTLRLDGVPTAERGRDDEIESGRLAGKETELVAMADKALLLLSEDASAVALPEALGQARADMEQVAQRLSRNEVDLMTQGIEEDIIAALEEMIAVLQKELAELGQQQPSQPGQQGEQGEPPLIDSLAELKMIRSLQMRVNKRTQGYTAMIEGEQTVEPEIVAALRDLADRQERIYRATRDIVTGRNQ